VAKKLFPEDDERTEEVPPLPDEMREHWRAKYLGHPLVGSDTNLREWVTDFVDKGQLARRWTKQPEQMRDVLDVLDALAYVESKQPPIPIQLLGIRLEGDAHAFDLGTSLGRLLDRAIAARHGRFEGTIKRRAAYAEAGIQLDSVSSTVLVAGFRTQGPQGVVSQRLDAAAKEALPAVLTLAEVERIDDGVSPEVTPVSCCENPAVLEAALLRYGRECPPVVCLGGRPHAAGLLLVRHLREADVPVRFHGDYDWVGLEISEKLREEYGVEPWLFCAAEYRRHFDDALRPLKPPISKPKGDEELVEALTAGCFAVYEEQCLGELVDSLKALVRPD
jgi:uncharacterized protein (TIGR02679 family)